MLRYSLAIVLVFSNLTICSHATAQQNNLHILSLNPARELALAGFDTSNVDELRRLVDTTSEARHLGAYASVVLARRGNTDILPNIITQYYQALDEYISFDDTYLYAITLANPSLGHQMVQAFVDTMLDRKKYNRKPYHSEIGLYDAIRMLVNFGDYSRYSLFIDIVESNKQRKRIDFKLLLAFASNVALRDSVYQEILSLIQTITDAQDRRIAIDLLRNFVDKPLTQPTLRGLATTDSSARARDEALHILKYLYNDYFALSAWEQEAISTQDTTRFGYILGQIESFRGPAAILSLKNIVFARPTGYFHESAFKSYDYYRPQRPIIWDPMNPPSGPVEFEPAQISIDSLMTYLPDVAQFNWLSDQTFVDELDGYLTTARNYLVQGDSNNTARQIKLFQQKVNEEYTDSLDGDTKRVTIEGRKFLYYNAQYILDRLPTPPPQYAITTNIVGNGTITKAPDIALYDEGSTVQLTATSSTGYHLGNWSGDATGTTNPLSVTMSANKTITATFAINTYTLTATTGANGTITPLGTTTVNYGGNQSFTISANTGYHVDSLFVDDVSQGALTSYAFTNVTTNHTIRAVFKINTYAITASAGANGTVAPSGTTMVTHGGSQTYSITPNTNYHIDSVLVDNIFAGIASTYQFTTVIAPHTVRAVFAINTYPLTVTISPVGGGMVARSPNQSTYAHGSSVTLTATASSNYRFTGWTGDYTSSTNPLTVTMDVAKNVTANFLRTYQVTITSAPAGRSIQTDGVVYTSGRTFTWDSASSHPVNLNSVQSGATGVQYQFTNWSDGSTATSRSIIATSTTTYTANFTTQYLLTLAVNPAGSGTTTPASSSWYNSGTNASVSATAKCNYAFANWTGGASGTSSTTTVLMNQPKTATANFNASNPVQYSLAVTVSGTGTYAQTPIGVTCFTSGQSVTLTAKPGKGSVFLGWSGSITGTTNPITFTMNANKAITVSFGPAPGPQSPGKN